MVSQDPGNGSRCSTNIVLCKLPLQIGSQVCEKTDAKNVGRAETSLVDIPIVTMYFLQFSSLTSTIYQSRHRLAQPSSRTPYPVTSFSDGCCRRRARPDVRYGYHGYPWPSNLKYCSRSGTHSSTSPTPIRLPRIALTGQGARVATSMAGITAIGLMKSVPSSDRKDGYHLGRSMPGRGHHLYRPVVRGSYPDDPGERESTTAHKRGYCLVGLVGSIASSVYAL